MLSRTLYSITVWVSFSAVAQTGGKLGARSWLFMHQSEYMSDQHVFHRRSSRSCRFTAWINAVGSYRNTFKLEHMGPCTCFAHFWPMKQLCTSTLHCIWWLLPVQQAGFHFPPMSQSCLGLPALHHWFNSVLKQCITPDAEHMYSRQYVAPRTDWAASFFLLFGCVCF